MLFNIYIYKQGPDDLGDCRTSKLRTCSTLLCRTVCEQFANFIMYYRKVIIGGKKSEVVDLCQNRKININLSLQPDKYYILIFTFLPYLIHIFPQYCSIMDHKNENNHEEKNVRKKFEVLCQVCQNSLPTVREPTRRPWPIYKYQS